jgi:hypothetical protein
VDYFTESPIALVSSHRLFPAGHTAGTDRLLLESNPSSPEGVIGSRGCRRYWSLDGLRHVLGIDRVAYLGRAGLEVGCGEFPELFSRRPQVCGAVIETAGGQNPAGFDLPWTVALDQHEAFVRRD